MFIVLTYVYKYMV